jgi:HD-GYP domain-containing protein (c-di-GMP phosphodiesterase class II)
MGAAIPIAARVVAVCDAYDAMTSDRSYRRGMSPQVALEELRRSAGTQFDPRVVDAFCAALEAWVTAERPAVVATPSG